LTDLKAKDIFGLALRIVGLLPGILAIIYFLCAFFKNFLPNDFNGFPPAVYDFSMGAIILMFGLYFLSGASHVVRFACRSDKSNSKE
jgi:hypothetical protein